MPHPPNPRCTRAAEHPGRVSQLRAARTARGHHPADDGGELEGRIKNFDRFARDRRDRRRRSHGLQARDRHDQRPRGRWPTTSPHGLSARATAPSRECHRPRHSSLVLDSVGIGELPDAATYGDQGSDTLGNICRAVGRCSVPTLQALGLGPSAAPGVRRRRRRPAPTAAWPRRRPARTRSPGTGRLLASCSTGRSRRFPQAFRRT